jgi:hypothetical protein
MSKLRLVLHPKAGTVVHGVELVSGLRLGVASFGGAGAGVVEGPAVIEFACSSLTNARAKAGAPQPFATLSGFLRVQGSTARLMGAPTLVQPPTLGEASEVDGHSRPRRALDLDLSDLSGPREGLRLLLPDEAQAEHGHLEIRAKLEVNGEAHGTFEQNDALDVPLLRFRDTHAVFRFVDAENKPIAGAKVRVKSSVDGELALVTDQHGELYMEAPDARTFEVLEVKAAEELAVIAAHSTSALA